MSLVIHVAYTGGSLKADGNSFASVEELQRWIEQATRLPPSSQVLMTSRGKIVKITGLSIEKEIFLYDRKQLDTGGKPVLDPPPKLPNIGPFPDDIESETDMASWRELFKRRQTWANYCLQQANTLAQKTREADITSKIMIRSVTVAFSSLETHSAGLGKSLEEMRKWAEGVMEDRDRILGEWEPAVRRLMRIPVHDEFKNFGGREEKHRQKASIFLSDLINIKDVQTAASTSGILADRFEKDVSELGMTIEDICGRTATLKSAIQRLSPKEAHSSIEENLRNYMEEFDEIVGKIRSDYEYVRGLQGPKAVAAASKKAYASTTELLPGLQGLMHDMAKLLVQTVERKNAVSKACLEHLQNIAAIQSMSQPVNPQINRLDAAYTEEEASFELLSLVLRLPVLYGSLLLESVRRREWSEKFSGSSQKLAEELALSKEEEEKRRRKWFKNTGSLLPLDLNNSSQIQGAELNIRGDLSGGFPTVTRKDIESYISTLSLIDGTVEAVKELNQALQELDKAPKRINKRLKGFKLGSVHEANLMNSSMFGLNEEEVKQLRAEKVNLAERIKGYESRIRKLEDLLHRRSANPGAPYQPPTSPVPQNAPTTQQTALSPESNHSVAPVIPRRRSSEAAIVQPLSLKIAALQAELAVEKDITSRLQREASEKTESERAMNARITQADDTKRDLVANLEATVQQHVSERKEFEKEMEDLKQKLEDAYEEMDRMEEERVKVLESELGSMNSEMGKLRELHEKDKENLEYLNKELESLRQRKSEDEVAIRAELELQTTRGDEESHRASRAEVANAKLLENVAKLEGELNAAKDALASDHLKHVRSKESLVMAMKQAHGHLSSDMPPQDMNALMDQIETLVAKSVAQNKEFSSQLEQERNLKSSLQTDYDVLKTRFEARTMKAKDLTQRLFTHNARSIQLLEELGYRVVRGGESMQIVKIPRTNTVNESTVLSGSTANIPSTDATSQNQPVRRTSPLSLAQTSSTMQDVNLMFWTDSDSETEAEKYSQYLKNIGAFDIDSFTDTIKSRIKKSETDGKQLMKTGRAYREKYHRAREEASGKIAFKSFKQGDLALFLPTRNQVTRPWAAFNVGAPHFFLNEQDNHKLATRDWLLARITKVEERIVDLSRSRASIIGNLAHGLEHLSIGGNSSDGGLSVDDENPFELSDGLRWYLLDAVEEKPGAPTTPGLSSSTVASANVDAKGSLKPRKLASGAKKKLSEITTEHSRRGGGGSNRNSTALSTEQAAAVRAAVQGGGDTASMLVESVPSTPRTPVEKVVSFSRSRAASFRSLASLNPSAPAPGQG